ncbi:MAG: superoxide dismutase [Ilumatobacteraceae bacterium]|nr:superoxide dismutase [Acidimicrobiales bacterium]MCB9394061.1 superoxide dismutase [Acidimicrobiaceae bacterium]
MTYTLPALPYDPASLEPHLSATILELHHDKHHQAYVDGANKALDQLAEARATGDFASLVGLQKTLAFNTSGHVLHSLYWQNLGPDGGDKPVGDLAAAIDDQFGSFDAFRKQMTAATVSVQGSGWSALVWEPVGQQLMVEQVEVHHESVLVGSDPLLVIDAWEHAYYLQYQNRRAEYAEAIWNVVNWDDVARRFAAMRG